MTPRSVLITGAARGIGHAIAQRFVNQGDRVLLADVSVNVHDAAASLAANGGEAQGHVVDLSDTRQIDGVAAAMQKYFGGCDVLVNCAGIAPMTASGTPIAPTDLSLDDWQRVLTVNLTAPYLLCKAFIPGMKTKGFGRIVNISSRAGRTFVLPVGIEYAASKAGLIGLTRQLAGTYAGDGITVNAIAPGRIVTPLSSTTSGDLVDATVKAIPSRRLGVPDEIAAAVQFLASEGAAYITGACLDVNGGLFIG